jgi:large subunit ribosomal protein L22
MEAKAKVRQVRISSTKVGIVLDLIRGKDVKEADAILQFTPKDAAIVIRKLLKSAVANAENNFDLDIDRLYVAEAYAGQGSTLKRFRPRAQGRAYGIKKRSSNITVVVKERN